MYVKLNAKSEQRFDCWTAIMKFGLVMPKGTCKACLQPPLHKQTQMASFHVRTFLQQNNNLILDKTNFAWIA